MWAARTDLAACGQIPSEKRRKSAPEILFAHLFHVPHGVFEGLAQLGLERAYADSKAPSDEAPWRFGLQHSDQNIAFTLGGR